MKMKNKPRIKVMSWVNEEYKQKNPWLGNFTKIKLFEQETVFEPIQVISPQTTEQPQGISLDQKVDSLFIQYEKEASLLGRELSSEPMMVQEEFYKAFKNLKTFLFEADDPMAAGAPPDPVGGAAGAPDPGGADSGMPDMGAPPGAGGEATDAPEIPTPKIDINTFASLTARLIMNIDTLLDPKTTILRRAQTYIAKNYNNTVARELMTKLDLQYGISARDKEDKSRDYGSAPIADGAAADGPSGS